MSGITAACVVSSLFMAVIVGGDAMVSEAAEPALVIRDGLAVYPAPVESGVPVKRLDQGQEVLTMVEILDSRGTGWCDILSKSDEEMLGYVRCDGLKMVRQEKPEYWREVPAPQQTEPPGEGTRTPSAGTPADNLQGQSPGKPVKPNPQEYDPRQLRTY